MTKTDAFGLHTFQTRGCGILGVVDRDRVVYYRDLVKRYTSRSEFDVARVDRLPRVDLILTYQDAPGDLIRAAVDRGAKGIVLATAGATNGRPRRDPADVQRVLTDANPGGGPDGIRTRDLVNAIHARSQLRHWPSPTLPF